MSDVTTTWLPYSEVFETRDVSLGVPRIVQSIRVVRVFPAYTSTYTDTQHGLTWTSSVVVREGDWHTHISGDPNPNREEAF